MFGGSAGGCLVRRIRVTSPSSTGSFQTRRRASPTSRRVAGPMASAAPGATVATPCPPPRAPRPVPPGPCPAARARGLRLAACGSRPAKPHPRTGTGREPGRPHDPSRRAAHNLVPRLVGSPERPPSADSTPISGPPRGTDPLDDVRLRVPVPPCGYARNVSRSTRSTGSRDPPGAGARRPRRP